MLRPGLRRLATLAAVVFGFVLWLGAVEPAHATLIDFATLPGGAPTTPGEAISTQYASLGVRFAVQTGASFTNASISDFTCCGTPTPALVNSFSGHNPGGQSLDIFFSSLVSVTFKYDNYGTDFTGNAFGCYTGGTLVEIGAPTSASTAALETESCSEPVDMIRIFQPTDSPTWIFAINDIQINDSVPEPATLFLLGAGLLGFAAIRRQRA